MADHVMQRDNAIETAIAFLRKSGCHYDEIGHVMYHSRDDLDAQVETLWDEFLQHGCHDASRSAAARAEIDALKSQKRPHWSVAFVIHDPPGVVTCPNGPIVLVYDDGHTEFFDVL